MYDCSLLPDFSQHKTNCMNLKQEAAAKAVSLIQNYTAVGLGAGATMAYMVALLAEAGLTGLQLFTSSAATKNLLLHAGYQVGDVSAIAELDVYFDGCDQFDQHLNALKSGGGIHTAEKLLASMAKEFVLVGDESKYAEKLDTKYPVVLEILPQAAAYVPACVQQLFSNTRLAFRKNTITENGNLLADVWFASFPGLEQINPHLKSITGVVETSLFYNMATKAVVAGQNGVVIMEP